MRCLFPKLEELSPVVAALRLDESDGVLFGVHPKFSGHGILGQLIERSKRWCMRKEEATTMVYSTQP